MSGVRKRVVKHVTLSSLLKPSPGVYMIKGEALFSMGPDRPVIREMSREQ